MSDKAKHTDNSNTLLDPVCGMDVTKDSEHHIHLSGHDYYFCSSNCHDKFEADPEQYAQPTTESDVQLKDPVCGMDVTADSEHHLKHNDQNYYFCSSNCHDKFEADPEQYTQPPAESDVQLKDPVCGMDVTADSEHHLHHKDHEYYFCSENCKEKFEASPDTYLNPVAEQKRTPPDDMDSTSATYTCPMHPEMEQQGPGACPKCGMALEPKGIPLVATKTEYTCPMHPEIVQDHPGNCPKCGMSLEAVTVEAEEDTSELDYMSKRFWISAALAIPVLFSAMAAEFWPERMAELIDPNLRQWIEMLVSAPVIVWGGWIFYVRAIQSVITRNLNMFTLIGLGVSVAFTYSVIATVAPGIFPPEVFNEVGVVPVYFEAAAVITALILLGQVLELRARSQTNAAIKLLLGLAPKTARIVRDDGTEEDIPMEHVQVGDTLR
ncbi:MAG: YHS domain-containing protein, partial [Gammaproteobacteria bacterium]